MGELELKPREFWVLTYAEFFAMAEGFKRRRIDRQNALIYHAWHCEAFARQKTLPELKNILQKSESTHRQQTEEEMIAICRMLNAAFGGDEVMV